MPDSDFFDPVDAPRDGTFLIFYLPDPNRPNSEDQVIAAFDANREAWRDRSGNIVDVSSANSAAIYGEPD